MYTQMVTTTTATGRFRSLSIFFSLSLSPFFSCFSSFTLWAAVCSTEWQRRDKLTCLYRSRTIHKGKKRARQNERWALMPVIYRYIYLCVHKYIWATNCIAGLLLIAGSSGNMYNKALMLCAARRNIEQYRWDWRGLSAEEKKVVNWKSQRALCVLKINMESFLRLSVASLYL